MTTVKICGIRTIEHALAAAAAGADLLGLVFAPSRRQIAIDEAATIVTAVRQHTPRQQVRFVGLFVNEQTARINTTIERCDLDYVQLSGDETLDQAYGLIRPLIKSLRLSSTPAEEAWLQLFQQQMHINSQENVVHYDLDDRDQHIRTAPCPLLVDAHVPGAYGGTGTLADWDHAQQLARQQPLILAGGLTPENVAAAITQVRPWGVDVSSGVETNGIKDVAKISAFVTAVQSVDRVSYVH